MNQQNNPKLKNNAKELGSISISNITQFNKEIEEQFSGLKTILATYEIGEIHSLENFYTKLNLLAEIVNISLRKYECFFPLIDKLNKKIDKLINENEFLQKNLEQAKFEKNSMDFSLKDKIRQKTKSLDEFKAQHLEATKKYDLQIYTLSRQNQTLQRENRENQMEIEKFQEEWKFLQERMDMYKQKYHEKVLDEKKSRVSMRQILGKLQEFERKILEENNQKAQMPRIKRPRSLSKFRSNVSRNNSISFSSINSPITPIISNNLNQRNYQQSKFTFMDAEAQISPIHDS